MYHVSYIGIQKPISIMNSINAGMNMMKHAAQIMIFARVHVKHKISHIVPATISPSKTSAVIIIASVFNDSAIIPHIESPMRSKF